MPSKKNAGTASEAAIISASLLAGRASLEPLLQVAPVAGATRYERELSRLLDRYFASMLDTLGGASGKIALVATGGYGRSELCPGSDIDILILCKRSIPPQVIDLAQPLFLPLWDAGYTLGHGFRTVSDCLKLAAKDYKVLASLLDARFIAGSEAIFTDLLDKLQEKVLAKRGKNFVSWLDSEHERRLAAHGDGALLLAPNLKEGLGGLRDYHLVRWLLSRQFGLQQPFEASLRAVGFVEEDIALLRANVDYLHDVRSRLHVLTGRRSDLLPLEMQPDVARSMGYVDGGGLLAVERFLGDLHRCMGEIKALAVCCREALTLEGAVVLQSGQTCQEASPQTLLNLMKQTAIHPEKALGAWRLRRSLAQLATERADELAALPQLGKPFCELLVCGNAWDIFERLDDTGLLCAMLPEYATVRDRVQFDGFHTYPVGLHTLVTLRCLEQTETSGGMASVLWRQLDVSLRCTVMLAALLHDLGKTGKPDHAEAGAKLAEGILSRWEIAGKQADDVVFLVRNHLLLSRTALRRDLADESVIARSASIIGDTQRLDLLYLLAVADARATGPRAWNGWVSGLLEELYHKILNMLQDSVLGSPEAVFGIAQRYDAVQKLLTEKAGTLPFTDEQGAEWLERVPSRYILSTDPAEVLEHFALMQRLEHDIEAARQRLGEKRGANGVVLLEARNLGDVWELAIAAKDQPGLFSVLTGVLALHGLDVFSADAFVWNGGVVLDVFRVSPPPDPLYAKDFWVKVRGSVHFALTGKLSLDFRLEEMRSRSLSPVQRAGGGTVQVGIDNSLSDFYSVIDVAAPDRPVLLYDIARTLQNMHIDIQFARIATHGMQTNDSFSVRDTFGNKLLDEEQRKEIIRALEHVLAV
ncbi:HD domain-containing protein [Oleidesulfovibrio sp.]|uniref:[protein-PII] uridylyltransferase family protein n=1 Tax=Oleidesulfovibrio sp. TaxID=2909707 RepID=UPI003A87C0B9